MFTRSYLQPWVFASTSSCAELSQLGSCGDQRQPEAASGRAAGSVLLQGRAADCQTTRHVVSWVHKCTHFGISLRLL